MNIEVYFDGGASPNPGKAYGSYEVEFDIDTYNHKVERMPLGDGITNNQAEYMTMIEALKWLVGFVKAPENEFVIINSDSKLVVEQMNGRSKVKHPRMKDLHRQAMELCGKFFDVQFRWQSRDNNVERFGH